MACSMSSRAPTDGSKIVSSAASRSRPTARLVVAASFGVGQPTPRSSCSAPETPSEPSSRITAERRELTSPCHCKSWASTGVSVAVAALPTLTSFSASSVTDSLSICEASANPEL